MNRFFSFYLCFVSLGLAGQDRLDLFTVSGNYGLPTTYDSIYKGKGTESGLLISAVAPVKLSEKSIWYTGLNYLFWNVDNDETMPDMVMNPINIHGFLLRTGLIHQLNNGHNLQVLLFPRLMSDFQNISIDHFQLGAIATYGKRYHKDLKLGFGALFNQEFFGPNLVPLIDINWNISPRWTLAGLFPIYAKAKYQVNSRLDIGWSHFGLVTTYRLGATEFQGDYIDRRSIDETLYARYQLFGNLFLEGRVGYSFGRSYTQYAADEKVDLTLPLISIGDNREARTSSIQSGMIASLRLVYAIPIDN
jgi:hypothetical protein